MPKPTTNQPSQGNAQLDGGQFIAELQNGQVHAARLAQFFSKIIAYVNGLASSSANSGSGEIPPPPPLAGLSVSVPTTGELVHFGHNHPGAIQRGGQYFTEIGFSNSTTPPTFAQPLVIDHGASRTEAPVHLPTQDANGNTYTYVARGYAQYHGSVRSGYAYYGTESSPTTFQVNGTTQMTLLPSFGSGTASNSGTQGGQGLGNDLFRAASGPKRQVGQ